MPNQLKIIKILDDCVHSKYNKDLNNLPNSIEIIELNKNYNKPIVIIPKNLKLIKCHKDYKHFNILENHKLTNNLSYIIETFE